MPEAVVVFDLAGTICETRALSLPDLIARALGGDFDWAAKSPGSAAAAELLNQQALRLSARLEAEILDALPSDPPLRTQVELRFRHGSTFELGTVAVTAEAGAAACDRLGIVLADIVRDAARRVVGSALAQTVPGADTVQCIVTPRWSPTAAAVVSAGLIPNEPA